MENPIPRNGLFATKTLAEIQEYIEAMPTEARATAYLIMMMTLNASHELVKELQLQTPQGRIAYLRSQVSG